MKHVNTICSILLFSFLLSPSLFSQTQVGLDIDGEAASDQSGSSVSLSDNGSRLAIGARLNDGTATNAGHVRVYNWNGSSWAQLGVDINGEAADDYSGYSVSLSGNGERVAIGAHGNDDSGTDAGHVRVYEWSGSFWTQVGADIDGEAVGDRFGVSVSLSTDGNRLAAGADYNDGNGSKSGHVRVFDWDGSNWTQAGADIDGEAAGDESGWSVSLSGDGNRIAIGAWRNSGTAGNAGHARVYEWNSSTWTQLGGDINGEAPYDLFGYAVSLASDGSRVAVGAPQSGIYNNGAVGIFDWNGSGWSLVGANIYGEGVGDKSGTAVALTSDGTRVVIGAPNNDGTANGAGHTRVYDWNSSSSSWTHVYTDFDGEAGNDHSGRAVAISSDGAQIAIGAPDNDGTGLNAGHVRVYGTIPVPVELIAFRAEKVDNAIVLNWQTASELNNEGFEIQKSADGKNWEVLDFVEGRGTIYFMNDYEFTDREPFKGMNYYRLKQIDFDKQFEFSNTVAVAYEVATVEIAVYPNPTYDQVSILIENTGDEKMNITLTDVSGRRIWMEQPMANRTNYSKEYYFAKTGIYFLTVTTSDAIYSKRIIVVKGM